MAVMYLLGIDHALPAAYFSQSDSWGILQATDAFQQLSERSRGLVQKVLLGDNGIDGRYFALPDIGSVFGKDASALNRAFEYYAPELAEQAVRKACERAHLNASDLDGVIVATCTGYLCPGISSYLAERLGLRANAYLADVVGHGCGAAIPTLRQAQHFLTTFPEKRIAVVPVEVCSAAFYMDNDPGVLISMCLFGDGASASIWSGQRSLGSVLRAGDFVSLHLPEYRDLLRFENVDGKLRNRLHRSVPARAAEAVQAICQDLAAVAGVSSTDLIIHPGGRDVIDAVAGVLPAFDYQWSRAVLRAHGNMSSPSVLFCLQNWLDARAGAGLDGPRGSAVDLVAFGAGFTAYGARLEVLD